jgi:two-component system, response regulator PdtaR
MPNRCQIAIILVVEDEPLIRMHGIDILEDAGFDVLEAANADEAMVILNAGTQVHLVFSDVDMPGSIDGLDLAQLVSQRWPAVRVLLTSGNHRLQNNKIPGTGEFFRKPWTASSLVERIQEMDRL